MLMFFPRFPFHLFEKNQSFAKRRSDKQLHIMEDRFWQLDEGTYGFRELLRCAKASTNEFDEEPSQGSKLVFSALAWQQFIDLPPGICVRRNCKTP